jgi:hypothetical protein
VEAQRQAHEAAGESASLRAENAALKAAVAQLEQALGISPAGHAPPLLIEAASVAAGAGADAGALVPWEAQPAAGGLVVGEQARGAPPLAVQAAAAVALPGDDEGAEGLRQRRGSQEGPE